MVYSEKQVLSLLVWSKFPSTEAVTISSSLCIFPEIVDTQDLVFVHVNILIHIFILPPKW